MNKPEFQPGETATTTRYIPPIPKGATVTVLEIYREGNDVEYEVQGNAVRGKAVKVIQIRVRESDLRRPFL